MSFDKNVIDDIELCNELLNISKNILNDKIEVENDLINFFKKLSTKHLNKTNSTEQSNYLIEEIKDYIIVNLENNPTLENISNNFGLSKEHLIRVFKKELGLTPHAFLTNLKINFAKNNISNEEFRTLTDVAYDSGFYDQSHFTKAFKKVFAIKPSEVLK